MKKSLVGILSLCLLALSALGAGLRNSQPAATASDADKAQAALIAGMDVAEFLRMSKLEPSLHLDRAKRPFFACENVAALGQLGPDTTPHTSPATYPLPQTFLLHSRPGAAKVIYLDFNGHVTSGTPWNTNYTAGADITTPAFDTDGNPGSFSEAELTAIQEVWRRVSEDYAAWDIDVTTENPGAEAIRRTSQADSQYGVRVVIGGSSADWLGANAGGVAYINSFPVIVSNSSPENDTPVFVFPAQLANAARYIAEASAHEVGHTLGLYHSGQTNGTEYYAGHADWAPIMGTSYFKEVTQWTRHDYPLANNNQDQLWQISRMLPVFSDEFGDNSDSSAFVDGNTLTAGGVITSGVDTDWFKIRTGAGTITLNGLVSTPSPNLKLSLSLVDGTGALVAQGSAAGMGAMLSANVTGGDYYVIVDGIGTGDALTAYTDYSSLGRYGLFGSWTTAPIPNQAPTASTAGTTPLSGTTPLTVQFIGSGSSDPDGTVVSYLWDFGDGTTSAQANVVHEYATVGDYVATLTVTDNEGATGTASVSVNVAPVPNQAPLASTAGTIPLSGTSPLTVQFVGSASTDADGTIVSYLWDFGDGSTSTLADPAHAYPNVGTYVATLTVTDNEGATGTASVSITVSPLPANQPPVASTEGTSPTSGLSPLTVQFVGDSSYDPDGSIVTYSWSFGDGYTSALANPSHQYAAAGAYTATLTVIDNRGALATSSVNITVSAPVNQPPVASTAGTTPTSGNAALTVQFVGGNSSDPDGSIVAYSWNFGDGSSASTLANPSHTYATAGSYAATLSVTDSAGAIATATILITVATPPPTAYSKVAAIELTWVRAGQLGYVQSVVTLTDQAGNLLRNTPVSAVFGGLISEASSATTNNKGQATFKSTKISGTATGTISFTVTQISAPGLPYYPAGNTVTSATLVR